MRLSEIPPIRARSFFKLLVLLSIGVLYHSWDGLSFFLNVQGPKNVPGSDTLPYLIGGVGSVRTHQVQRTDEWRNPPGLSLLSTQTLPRQYEKWLNDFSGTIRTPVYFFTPLEIASLVTNKRGSLPISANSSYTNPFDVPPVQESRDYCYKLRRWQKTPELTSFQCLTEQRNDGKRTWARSTRISHKVRLCIRVRVDAELTKDGSVFLR